MKTRKQIMTEAHKIARKLEGNYQARMSAALKIVWLSECLDIETVGNIHDDLLNGDFEARAICTIVSFFSNGFQADIADNFLTKGYRLTEKQAWCVAYEFKNVA